MKRYFAALTLALVPLAGAAQNSNLVIEGIPEIPAELVERVAPYLESRAAGLTDWHPTFRAMIISTRFGSTAQLHQVRQPLGSRKQLTFFNDAARGGRFEPRGGEFFIFSKDIGGGEFFQIYRYDFADGRVTLLTDGKSRNTGAQWSNSGKWLAYNSTRRNGRDTDFFVVDPRDKSTTRLLAQVEGGGWGVSDWSADDRELLAGEYVSANESYIWLIDSSSGRRTLLTPKSGEKISWSSGRFAPDGTIYATTDQGSEFSRLVTIDRNGKATDVVAPQWDVEEFEISRDGKYIAYVTNEDGVGVIHVIERTTRREVPLPPLAKGTITGIAWRGGTHELGFNLSSAKAPTDVYSIDVATGKLDRWTESETGGLNTENNIEPELIRTKSFDGLTVSGFLFRPDAKKFPGKRPVIISIHGGPESQWRPSFLGRSNYYLNEMGVALFFPNVRGSSGYGKTFLSLDNGYKREESVKDIGAFISWLKSDPKIDGSRIMVMGGSYGGYMTLASMIHFSDELRSGMDVVGISDFVTFLNNTQDYRRDLRRAEYGDERDPAMRAYLDKISPLKNASKIKKPLFIVQGYNDPRVPYTEAEQILKAVRANQVPAWYLMAKDEGHGFAKKPNADYHFLATILFVQETLLK